MDMIEWFRPMGGDSGEMDMVKMPARFEWINKSVTVIGEDFSYEATCLCAFPKTNGKVRYIVEDRGRLFIQRESQLVWMDEPKPQAPETEHSGVVALARPSPSGSGCPHCGYFHPPDGMCAGPSQTIGEALELQYNRERNKGEDPLGR
jgi:hypothetical protein